MPEPTTVGAWTRAHVARIARQYFPGRSSALLDLTLELAKRHETAWRTSSTGVFRPTPSMYALALGWELDRLGPRCVFCKGKVEVPRRLPPTGPSGPTLALGLRVPPEQGGFNVPQNLSIGHASCFSGH